MSAKFSEVEFAAIKDMIVAYEWGQRTLLTLLDIVQQDFEYFHKQNPIEHIRGRIKSYESIAEKLQRLGHDITAANARNCLYDIAGIRIICAFAEDIYTLAEVIKSVPNINVIIEKDYISKPKPSGYRSYHIIAEVPVFYSAKTEVIPVEIQIRTSAMDFWATLEHKARYKYKEHIPQHLCDELAVCADAISDLDNRMFLIHEIISLINR